MQIQQKSYIHALRFQWLNRLYDPVVRCTTRETLIKTLLVEQIPAATGKLLDIASGTGTLTRAIKAAHPDYDVTGVDGDGDMLERARSYLAQEGALITYDQALAQRLPYSDSTFDVVTSSLFFHHLTLADKSRALQEAYRVMRPGGVLLVADWGKPQNWLMRALFLVVQCLDGFETTKDHVKGRLPTLVGKAGFQNVVITKNTWTPLGTISLLRASK